MTWPEAAVLIVATAGASTVAVATSFDPLPVYTAVVAWGASRTVTAP